MFDQVPAPSEPGSDGRKRTFGKKETPLGTRPAGKTPAPAPLGTSGRVSKNLLVNRNEVNGESSAASSPHKNKKEFLPEVLPSVPDEKTDLPDSCSDAAGQNVNAAGQGPLIGGEVRVGRMFDKRDRFRRLRDARLADVLEGDQPDDTVIEGSELTEFSVVDVDTHDWKTKPTPEYLNAIAADIVPEPDAWWISHGMGLKLIYVGPHHDSRALAAAFAVPASFTVELLDHTRHPGSSSTSPSHRGAACGPVHLTGADSNVKFEFRGVGRLTAESKRQALEELDMEEGGKYDHDRCPIDPDPESDAKDCVHVLDRGVFCHRCAAKGIRFSDHLKPGLYPFAPAGETSFTVFDEMARNRVHWTHAQLVLKHEYPNFANSVLEKAYESAIRQWMQGELRVEMVFNPNLDFVWGDGLWLDVTKFEVTKVDNDAISGMAYAHDWDEDNGRETVRLDPVKRSVLKNRTPQGYTPVRPVRGISFRSDDMTIPVPAPPQLKHAIELLADPLPLDEAFSRLEKFFPKVDRRYLLACLAAAICADAKLGQPPMLTCRGPSGSGKEQHIRLAASFMGEDIKKLTLSDNDEAFKRQLGSTLAAGHRFLVFDEFGKTPGLFKKIKSILEISTWIQWRPLYMNHLVSTPVHAALFFPCVNFPEFLGSSEEFVRRTRDVQLYRKLPDWRESSGGDTASWRDASPENALIANSILTHIWRLCHDSDYRFF